MAGAIQIGDVINFGRLAWDIYRYGWSDEFNATKQYTEFGRDVKGLAENLDILSQVVHQATNSLQTQGAYNAVARWDPASLDQIIGDYGGTLRECEALLRSNDRYRVGSTALRNVEWNVLVQPSADALRQRIALHNSKILHFLKPFEIDLLCRVRQDIYRVHQDLAQRITAVHHDVHRLMGVLVPDLETALNQQARRFISLLDVPMDVAERFRFAALADRPEYSSDDAFELEELSDAFVLNYKNSTINFHSGMLVADRVPPLDEYVNLLKCVWLLRRIKDSTLLLQTDVDSHWPSYVRQLEDELSTECSRFGQELVKPQLITSSLKRDMFSIWVEKEPTPLVDVVTKDEMMEQLLEMPLQSSTSNIEQKVKLLRRLGSDGKRFRVMISGTEQTASGRPRQQTEVIDFDITAAVITPHYALPESLGTLREIILRRDERIARMSFTKMSDVLKFQQAVTGFKAWMSYTEYSVMVSFVVAGLPEPIVEKACLQLWIPKQTDGSFVTNSDAAADANKTASPTRNPSMAPSAFSTTPTSPITGRRESFTSASPYAYELSSDSIPTSPIGRQPSLPTIPQRQTPSPGVFSSSWSPNPMRSSPPGRQSMFLGGGPQIPVRRPVGQPPSPRRSGTLAPTVSNSTNNSNPGRTFSISSAFSTAARSTTSNSSGSDGKSTIISTGSRTTGLLHKRPPKPMLVLFTQNPKDGQFSFVSIQIDEETAVNPDRCNCRRSGRDGASCPIAAIEKRKGDANLSARRYEASRPGGGETDWNVARLAVNNPSSTNDTNNWAGLKRLSIMFAESSARATFGGTPNQCHCKIKKEGDLKDCLKAGHRGLWGEVQEYYRKQGNDYHQARYGTQKHVVNGLMG
ncbi:hypothetical protein G7046_g2690 [Stylonectria norvegica]|nr:hypothetical protein G7046_g2690 [Stylonectria norvegica]